MLLHHAADDLYKKRFLMSLLSNPPLSGLLCPKLLLACKLHHSTAFWTCFLVPYTDALTATMQAEPANLASKRWGYIGNDATHHQMLDGLAVGTTDCGYFLTKQASALIKFGFVTAVEATEGLLP